MLNLKKLSEEYEVTACTWYKNDEAQNDTGFSYSEGPNGELFKINDRYRFVLQTKSGEMLHSTTKTISSLRSSLLAYPNPVQTGVLLTIEGVEEGSAIQIFNQIGTCVSHTIATGETVQLTIEAPSGLYLIKTTNGELKIIVNN